MEVKGTEVILQGWQRTWLGVPQQTVLIIPSARVRNVACEQDWVRFEWTRRLWRARPVELHAGSAPAAQRLASLLPATQTPGFEKRWVQLREYERRIAALRQTRWVTPVLVFANIAIYLALILWSGRLGLFDLQQLIDWGADFGPLTLHGQPWRLISALFLHMDLLHLAFNMWALWNLGRLAERLYGPWPYLVLYFSCGILASTTSVAWNLGNVSIGASGAIFGVLGAFLAFFLRRRNELPASLWRAHGVSTLLFAAFSIVSGALQPLIDNAAHVGGLVGGLVLGAVLALPLEPQVRQQFPFKETLGALMLAAAGSGALLLQVVGLGSPLRPAEQYFRVHEALISAQTGNLRRWQELAAQQAQGTISDGELGRRFEKEILPFWQQASGRLDKEIPLLPAAQLPTAKLMSELAQLRVKLAGAVIAVVGGDSAQMSQIQTLDERASLINARLERIQMRTTMDYQARSLSQSPWALATRRWLPGHPRTCVEEPAGFGGVPIAPTDSATDGPAMREAAGCRAQKLFLSGDYVTLDALIRGAEARLNDLPDGGSTLTGIYGGLDHLFTYGRITVQEALSHSAAWRRAVPGSMQPDLVEAQLLQAWAWSARGTGYAADVSRQAWAAFAYRTEMAAASLEDSQPLAQVNPYWYQVSLGVGLDQSAGVGQLRTVFNEGARRFPGYHPLYGAMLRILMPRWFGSYDKVNDFIRDVSHYEGRDPDLALYARLYWNYASLERDEIDIFVDAQAHWYQMREGFRRLRQRYPRSDVLLNGFAKLACMADDRETYAELRPQLIGHPSVTAWSKKLTLAACDAKMTPPAGTQAHTSP
jgi:rhomboid protease GluP